MALFLSLLLAVLVCSSCAAPPRKTAVVVDDAVLASDVRDRIRSEPQLRHATIFVEVRDGVVTLNGLVDDGIDRNLAESAAQEVEGVVAVRNRLELRRPSFPFRRR
jgi:osmotically-inducible protein OsmY